MQRIKQILAVPVFLFWGLAHYRSFWIVLTLGAGLLLGWLL